MWKIAAILLLIGFTISTVLFIGMTFYANSLRNDLAGCHSNLSREGGSGAVAM